ncbi:serine/threonine-protein phosphatase [Nitrogeniibacter mangrovi]|uniref:Serine/threonine-protein phosphatase n=1 Tax=Nitrogeniibacter mangrovi TaxID=2016596 RepID=A0A6C1B4T0_9RHOO|nr:protein phosphatase 2C domain-containing protein [Nitrogeniibacter mangrovi]QID18716.1 serine/threonine-protein phosphatase [Nitrogeniibacter mangrovi]
MAIKVETCAARHKGDREEQQDQVAIFGHPAMPGMLMAVLADGMGGHTGGAMAAEQVLLKAKQNFESFAPKEETPERLLAGIVQESHVVIKLTRFTSEQDPHSTAVVFMLQKNRADWVHCGDSRFYHFRGDRLVYRSPDHSLVGELQRKGRLSEADALNHPHRNVLLSCLGAEREPRVDLGGVAPLAGGDSFLLCSDGIWAYFDNAELGAVLATQNARDACQTLISRARERAGGEGDNLSLAVVRLVETDAGNPATEPPANAGFPRLLH